MIRVLWLSGNGMIAMKTIEIYAVISSRGSYDDYCEFVERCFTNMDDAVEYARNIDRSHECEFNIPQEVVDDTDDHFYMDYYNPEMTKFCEENGIPDGEHFSNRTLTQRRQVLIYEEKLHKCHDDWCIKYLLENYPQYTESDYKAYLECLDSIYDDWHECTIRKFDLVVSDDFKL